MHHGLNAAMLPPLIACEPKAVAQDHDLRSATGSEAPTAEAAEPAGRTRRSASSAEAVATGTPAASQAPPSAASGSKPSRGRQAGKPKAKPVKPPHSGLRKLTEAECELFAISRVGDSAQALCCVINPCEALSRCLLALRSCRPSQGLHRRHPPSCAACHGCY